MHMLLGISVPDAYVFKHISPRTIYYIYNIYNIYIYIPYVFKHICCWNIACRFLFCAIRTSFFSASFSSFSFRRFFFFCLLSLAICALVYSDISSESEGSSAWYKEDSSLSGNVFFMQCLTSEFEIPYRFWERIQRRREWKWLLVLIHHSHH